MKKILIITHAVQGTLGDSSAAAKLQQCLMDKFSQEAEPIEIKVGVITPFFPDSRYHQAIMDLFGDKPHELFYQSDLKSKLDQADLIILYPTPHFYDEEDVNIIAQAQKSVISMGEYNFDIDYQLNNKKINVVPGSLFFSTGIGQDDMGIFLNPSPIQEKQSVYENIHDQDKLKLPLDLGENKALYFGYFNKIGVPIIGATPADFVSLAHYLTPNQQAIDIIMPLDPSDSKVKDAHKTKFLLEKKFVNTLQHHNQVLITYSSSQSNSEEYFLYHYKDKEFVGESISKEEALSRQGNADKVMRIYNPFPLHPQTVKALIMHSEPINMITGDQSFSEALSLLKLPFYQIMPWKANFYKQLIQVVDTQKYPKLHEWFTRVSEATSVKDLADFYLSNQEMLKQELREFVNFLRDQRNIATLVPDTIKKLLEMSVVERFKESIKNIKKNPAYYFSQQNLKIDKFLLQHLDFYLKNASLADQKIMIDFFSAEISPFFEFITEDSIHFFINLKIRYPQLSVSLTEDMIYDLSKANLQSRGAIEWPFEEPEQAETLNQKPLTSFTRILTCLVLLQENNYSTSAKIKFLNEALEKRIFYPTSNDLTPNEINYWTSSLENFIKQESDVEVVQYILKLLLTTYCFEDMECNIKFNPEKPSLYFLIPAQSRQNFLEQILENPAVKTQLFESNPPLIKLILDDLLFAQNKRGFSLFNTEFKKWPPKIVDKFFSDNNEKQKELINNYFAQASQDRYKQSIIEANADILPVDIKNFIKLDNSDKRYQT